MGQQADIYEGNSTSLSNDKETVTENQHVY